LSLENYTDAELLAELDRRKKAWKPEPAFKCLKCGQLGYFKGMFSQANFERQHAQWEALHLSCQPFFNGGGI